MNSFYTYSKRDHYDAFTPRKTAPNTTISSSYPLPTKTTDQASQYLISRSHCPPPPTTSRKAMKICHFSCVWGQKHTYKCEHRSENCTEVAYEHIHEGFQVLCPWSIWKFCCGRLKTWSISSKKTNFFRIRWRQIMRTTSAFRNTHQPGCY